MKKLFRKIALAACAAGFALPGHAATLGLEVEGPVSSGMGGVFYDAGIGALLGDDLLNPLAFSAGSLDGSIAYLFFDTAGGASAFDIDGLGIFGIVKTGFTDKTLEFALSPGADSDSGALLRIMSDDFDFTGITGVPFPTSFFENAAVGGEFAAQVSFDLQRVAAVPLPGTALLLLSGLGAMGLARRKQRAGDGA